MDLARIFRVAGLTAVLVLSVLQTSEAFKIGRIVFEDRYAKGGLDLALRGAGLKKFLTIKVVAVGLYLPGNIRSEDVLSDIPRRLEVVYLQNIPSVELRRATTEGIRDNVTEKEFIDLTSRIEKMNALYPNVNRLDRIQVTYIPGKGTTVEVNGDFRGSITGEDFGRAFFAIWVGDKPVDPRIKQLILGHSRQKTEEI